MSPSNNPPSSAMQDVTHLVRETLTAKIPNASATPPLTYVNGFCERRSTPTPPPFGHCSGICTGGATCQSQSGNWDCVCPNGLTYSNGWCVDNGRCTEVCTGGSSCQKVGNVFKCDCNNGLLYSNGWCNPAPTTTHPAPTTTHQPSIATPTQGQCPPARRETSISKDISLDGGWIKINCEGGCIQIQKCMAGCEPGAQLPAHMKIGEQQCNGKSSCEIHPTSAQFGVSCSGWRRLWIMWKCKNGKDRSKEFIDESKKPNGWS